MSKKRLGFDLILLGDPTAGKDTQADILVTKFALKPVQSGKYWRSLGKRPRLSALLRYRQIKSLPAPVDVIKKFLITNLIHAPKNKDLIFVGTPKLKPEAEFLKKRLEIRKRDFLVIFISLPIKEIERRSLGRMRNLDDSKYALRRIGWYRNQQGKTVKYFQSLHKLRFINGNQTITKVHSDILKAINDYKRSRAD